MEILKAIEILKSHIEWRLGKTLYMIPPKELTEAITTAIKELESISEPTSNTNEEVFQRMGIKGPSVEFVGRDNFKHLMGKSEWVSPRHNKGGMVETPPTPIVESFSSKDVDFAYLIGVFNVSGVDGLHTEINRLKTIGKQPHEVIKSNRL